MKTTRRIHWMFFLQLVAFAGVMLMISFGPAVSSALAEKFHVRLGTSKEGTTAYACGVGLSACVNKYLKDVSMEAVPTPGSTASVKILGRKGVDICYAATWTLRDAYNNTGPFAKVPIPVERRPLQGWYFNSGDWFVTVKADRKDINSLHDLVGKKFYPFAAGTGIYDVYRAVFIKMGIWDKMKIRQVGTMEAPDALQMGTVDALGTYSNLYGFAVPSWVRNVDARLKIKVVRPSLDEQNLINTISGVTTGKILKKWMRPKNQDLNPNDLWGWIVHYGLHPAPDIPTEAFYQIYKAWIERAESELAPVHATLKGYTELGPLDLQIKGIEECKDIPVHPGVAKYLKEKGLWKANWIVGTLAPGVK